MFRALEKNTYYQKLYPTVNNEDLLEFRIPPNVKANMCLSDVLLRYIIRLPKIANSTVKVVPENLLGHKQFSSLEVRINGDAITRRSCSNEYFLGAYFQYQTNYSTDYACTSCNPIGYFDTGEFSTTELKVTPKVIEARNGVNDDYVYEIVMPIDGSIFTTNENLPTNTAVELSYERADSKFSTLLSDVHNANPTPTVLSLEDAYILVPYTIDAELQDAEKIAVSQPIKIKYDDYMINRFNIPKDSPNIRLANVISGPLPNKIFYGIMELDSYTGSYTKPSTRFEPHGVKKSTLYVDGNVLSGYPIQIDDNAITIPFVRFQENTNRFMNCYSSRVLSQKDFKSYHFLFSAKLDGSSSGSLTFEFDFDTAPEKDLVLITCSVYDRTIELDNFRNFKII
mgnify:CR=1 FL=1